MLAGPEVVLSFLAGFLAALLLAALVGLVVLTRYP